MFTFVILKKFIAIILLMQVGSNNVFAGELIRVPGLLKHYHHHQTEHRDVTGFVNFLHKHYLDAHGDEHRSGKHEHQDDDCNLPFKHCGDTVNLQHSFTGSLPTVESFDFIQDLRIQYRIEDDNISSLHVCHIWQPPKSA